MLNCLMCVQPTDKAHKVIIKGTSVAVRGMGVLPLPLAPLDVGCVMWAWRGSCILPPWDCRALQCLQSTSPVEICSRATSQLLELSSEP